MSEPHRLFYSPPDNIPDDITSYQTTVNDSRFTLSNEGESGHTRLANRRFGLKLSPHELP